jgi:peptide/nickel transport system substrate-binding protein
LNFRLAVAYATDADEMVTMALKEIGQKATTYMSPLYDWAVNSDPEAAVPAFNIDTAKEYLSKTSLTPDADGIYLKLTVDTYNYEPFPDLVQVMKSQLAKIGIEITINLLEYAAWDEKVNVNKDYVVTLTGGYQGPDASALGQRIVTDGPLNFLNYSNPEIDRLFSEALELPTFELRAPKYKEAQLILAKDVPMVVISEWLGYIPYLSYVKGHPAEQEVVDKTAFGEFTYMWLDK